MAVSKGIVLAVMLALVLASFRGIASSNAAHPQTVPLRARVAKLERQVRALSVTVRKIQAAVCPQFPPVCIPKEGSSR